MTTTTCCFFVPDPQGFEVSSLAGDPEDPEEPEDELQAAAERLTQDFLCQVIQEEEVGGEGKRMEPEEAEAEGEEQKQEEKGRSLCQSAPLVAILGKLQTTASLDQKQENADSEETERHPHQQRAQLTLTAAVAASFTGESSLQGGELDLDGIDDLEIDKVTTPSPPSSSAWRCLLL